MKIYIYQIYYDDRTKLKITKPFIPLDNSKNEMDDWFEFLPILNFLRKNNLEDDAWYGFLSPRFHEKTGLKSEFIFNVIEKIGHEADVAIFSHGWDQLSYFLNPWEQGEAWHPGLLNATQKFLDSQGVFCNIRELVTDTTSSVFSNYIIAKKQYWQEWKKIAEDFYKYSEDPKNYLNDTKVSYGTQESQYPLKTFIQERFASLILARGKFKTIAADQSLSNNTFSRLFSDDISTRRLLITCDQLKKLYREHLDENILKIYYQIREKIPYSKP